MKTASNLSRYTRVVPFTDYERLFVAECMCMEFPVMGEYHDNLSLDEALKIYETIIMSFCPS